MDFQSGVSAMSARDWPLAIEHLSRVSSTSAKYARAQELIAQARSYQEHDPKLALDPHTSTTQSSAPIAPTVNEKDFDDLKREAFDMADAKSWGRVVNSTAPVETLFYQKQSVSLPGYNSGLKGYVLDSLLAAKLRKCDTLTRGPNAHLPFFPIPPESATDLTAKTRGRVTLEILLQPAKASVTASQMQECIVQKRGQQNPQAMQYLTDNGLTRAQFDGLLRSDSAKELAEQAADRVDCTLSRARVKIPINGKDERILSGPASPEAASGLWAGKEADAIALVRRYHPDGLPGGGSVNDWFMRVKAGCADAGIKCEISGWRAEQSAGSKYQVVATLRRELANGLIKNADFYFSADIDKGTARFDDSHPR
jgi:hypothetical protein